MSETNSGTPAYSNRAAQPVVVPNKPEGTKQPDNEKDNSWGAILSRNPLWTALALVVATAVATYGFVVVVDDRVDRRVVERLDAQKVREQIDKRIDEKITSAFEARPAFSKQLIDSGYILFTQAIER